jgi:hypothetical protein
MPLTEGVLTILPAPEGYAVDFDNPRRQAVPHAYYIAGVGTVLSLLMVAQRLYTKIFVTGKLQLDDGMLGSMFRSGGPCLNVSMLAVPTGALYQHTWRYGSSHNVVLTPYRFPDISMGEL